MAELVPLRMDHLLKKLKDVLYMEWLHRVQLRSKKWQIRV